MLSLADIFYALSSLLTTGRIEEDSIFWNCALMGNRVCG